uniref:RSN1_7TM domain-containing protein n=1 Tax=Caenorhabditis tropicalis TaxID=1561998 RepID=A0A1I7TSD2_9PELO
MPAVWSKINEYWTWFLWGKTPYNELSDEMKKDARRDLYARLFFIANIPFFGVVYGSFLVSMYPATTLGDLFMKYRPPEKVRKGESPRDLIGFSEICKKGIAGFCIGVYIVLQSLTMGAGLIYVTIPFYSFAFRPVYSIGSSIFSRFLA